jgi:hypothetical protein
VVVDSSEKAFAALWKYCKKGYPFVMGILKNDQPQRSGMGTAVIIFIWS